MKRPLLLVLFLAFGSQRSSGCPQACSCLGSHVNCSGKSLTSSLMPTSFPPGTTELQLHNNLLTSLPNGILDDFRSLHSVSLHSNPWICDCGILYLRAWLLRQSASFKSYQDVVCSQPPNLKGRLVVYLTEQELLDSCHYWYCDLAFISQVCLFVFVVVQAALLVALLVFLRKFERMSREVRRITKESPMHEGDMREYENLKDTRIWNEAEISGWNYTAALLFAQKSRNVTFMLFLLLFWTKIPSIWLHGHVRNNEKTWSQ